MHEVTWIVGVVHDRYGASTNEQSTPILNTKLSIVFNRYKLTKLAITIIPRQLNDRAII